MDLNYNLQLLHALLFRDDTGGLATFDLLLLRSPGLRNAGRSLTNRSLCKRIGFLNCRE